MKFTISEKEPIGERVTEFRLSYAECGKDVLVAARSLPNGRWRYLVRFHTNSTVGFHHNAQDVGEELGLHLNTRGQIADSLSRNP